MRRCLPLVCLAVSLGAQDAPAPGLRFGGAVLVATGVGEMSQDLNGHPGFGLRINALVPLGSHMDLRPAFEWTGYRVSDYNLAARSLSSLLGADYQESRTVFRTYRLGMDGVFYFREGRQGPFLSLGAGVQRSQVYLEDRVVDSNGEQVTTLDTGSRKTGLWLGAGLGYQWTHGNLELRLSEAPYAYTSDRVAGSSTSAPFGGREGYALHLIWGARF